MDQISSQAIPQQPTPQEPVGQVSQQSSAPKMPKNSSKNILLILVTLLVLTALVGGAYYMLSQKQASFKKVAVAPTHTKQLTPTADLTADWKTFTPDRGNFSIKYPATWTAELEGAYKSPLTKPGDSAIVGDVIPPGYHHDPSGVLDGSVFFMVYKIASSAALSDWVKQNGYKLDSYTTTTIAGHDAMDGIFTQTQELFDKAKQTSPLPVGYKARYVYIKNGDTVIGITASGNIKNPDEYMKLFDQMLLTFQFTPQIISAGGVYTFASYQMTVPLDWTVTRTNNAAGDIVTVTKDTYKFTLTEGAMDGGACSYSDKPITTGIFQTFTSFVAFKDMEGTLYRRGKLEQSGYPGQEKYEVCAFSSKNNVFQEFTPFGRIDYLTPINADANILSQMDSILTTLKTQ